MNSTNCRLLVPALIISLFCVIIYSSCSDNAGGGTMAAASDTLTEEQKHLPENALKGLKVAKGLEVKPFATEPMLKNPTNIDVDERGRVWVTEAYNYRPAINENPVNDKGDRIMILEDTNGDGRADTAKVFYQGPEINAPLGVCVLGNRVLISQSPYVWAFYDDNGDDKADRKEILFQGIGGVQHDHGIHSFSFAPDGKLYFSFGNEGKTLKDRDGKTVRDQDGDEISPKKYRMGMLFRCNPDGSNVECLGQNFRNNYEAAVDSYGTIWQSDNDDDGNRGVRINYVMQHGNYGYTDEMTGAGWQSNRTNIEDSIPLRHWHLNDPGVVPNLLQTFTGSPTGMVIYEGSLLPEIYRGQMIHCDAGPNVVRSYPVKKDGAGYTASIVNILKGEKDQWFRPADVCVAPDGSLIIADWYDVGVGGHQAGDQVRGRIYRVAPPGSNYAIPKQDYTTAAGAVQALQNPNPETRYHAFTTLQTMGKNAVPELEKLWHGSGDPGMRARAFWALIRIPGADIQQYLRDAVHDPNPDLHIMCIRAGRELNAGIEDIIKIFSQDPDAAVRRECALALHHLKSPQSPYLWSTLANQYDGKDRWYLEALGIGADRQWDKFFMAWIDQGHPEPSSIPNLLKSPAHRDIVWRSRAESAIPLLAMLASDEKVPLKDRLRYFRAFDFHTGKSKSPYLLEMITKNKKNDQEFNKLALHHLDITTVRSSVIAQKALEEVLTAVQGTPEYVELAGRYEVKSANNNLLEMTIKERGKSMGRNAAGLLLKQGGAPLVWKVISSGDTGRINPLILAVSRVGTKESIDMIQKIILTNSYSPGLRKIAAHNLGKSWSGEERALELLHNKKVPADLIPDVVASVEGAWRGSIRSEAQSYLPNAPKTITKKMPSASAVLALKGDAIAGKAVFTKLCSVCHQVNKEGADFGPALADIGSKYPKKGLLDAILKPSEGISFNYEGWEIQLNDGSTIAGIISSKTNESVDLKLPGGAKQTYKRSGIKSMKQMKASMMTEGLYESMSNQDLANLLEYLSQLKKK